MRLIQTLRQLPIGELLDSLLPDLVLAFAFFTALIYGAVAKRFDHQRSAVAVSASMGLALSIGLVWWERRTGFSIRNLGPLAVGFAVLLLGMVLYAAVRQIGGSWAGAGLALGVSLLVAGLLGADWRIATQLIQTVTVVALIVGIAAMLLHGSGGLPRLAARAIRRPAVRSAPREVRKARGVSNLLDRSFRGLKKQTRNLNEHPRDSANILLQLRRMLPAEGWLTERMAELRAKAHRARAGDIARIEEIQGQFGKLPDAARKKAASQLADRYRQLRLDRQIEQLDRQVAERERAIRDLTQQAQQYLAEHNHRKLYDTLKTAEKLQKQVSHLMQRVGGFEKQLDDVSRQAAAHASEVQDA